MEDQAGKIIQKFMKVESLILSEQDKMHEAMYRKYLKEQAEKECIEEMYEHFVKTNDDGHTKKEQNS